MDVYSEYAHLLPPSVKLLAQVIGLKATLSLITEYHPRSRIYIPLVINETHRISACIGLHASAKLSECYGGTSLSFPLCSAYRKAIQRNKLIIADRTAGLSIDQLAVKYQLSTRHIRRIVPTTKTSGA